ncbi:MAG TPA: putative toxin-antitoxin system toxin component, PIN family [Candidatus Nanoarchaeia archaeon]|nr:putative toxin-antitoxin system toxin component, PIN family [Candidatus Nanoarchaeia archaeon]
MRVVTDTNLLIASLFWDGVPNKIIQLALDGKIRIIVSTAILEELRKTLRNPKEKFKLGEQEIEDVIFGILSFAHIVEPSVQVRLSRDPKDDIILACAQSSNADAIITRDNDLLVLKTYQGILIKTPEEFLSLRKV